MPRKLCGSCGLSWPTAKRACTCGKSLLKRKSVGEKPVKKKPHRICSACGAEHAPNRKVCTTCGNVMIAAPATPAEGKRFRYSCSACGLEKGNRHKCQKRRTLFLPERASKNKQLAPKASLEAGPALNSWDQTPARPSKSVVHCGVCRLQIHISRLTNQCTATTGNPDVAKIKQTLQIVEETARHEIAKLREHITQMKQLVDKTCPTKCAFALMRQASANSGPKQVKTKKQSKKPAADCHANSIRDALRDSQDQRNTIFLNLLASGQLSLDAPKFTSRGQLIRPAAVSTRMTASRRMKTVTRGLLDAAQSDGATLVWLIRSLYNKPGFTRAFEVALLHGHRTVFLPNTCHCNSNLLFM